MTQPEISGVSPDEGGTELDMGVAYDYVKARLSVLPPKERQDEMWRIDVAFLDQQIAEHKPFRFAANPAGTRPDGPLWHQVEYLLSHGYKLQTTGGITEAVPA